MNPPAVVMSASLLGARAYSAGDVCERIGSSGAEPIAIEPRPRIGTRQHGRQEGLLIEKYSSLDPEPVAEKEAIHGWDGYRFASDRKDHAPLNEDDPVGAAGPFDLATQVGQPTEEALELGVRRLSPPDRSEMRLVEHDVVVEKLDEPVRRRVLPGIGEPAGKRLLHQ
jgi:hypothetical protein